MILSWSNRTYTHAFLYPRLYGYVVLIRNDLTWFRNHSVTIGFVIVLIYGRVFKSLYKSKYFVFCMDHYNILLHLYILYRITKESEGYICNHGNVSYMITPIYWYHSTSKVRITDSLPCTPVSQAGLHPYI